MFRTSISKINKIGKTGYILVAIITVISISLSAILGVFSYKTVSSKEQLTVTALGGKGAVVSYKTILGKSIVKYITNGGAESLNEEFSVSSGKSPVATGSVSNIGGSTTISMVPHGENDTDETIGLIFSAFITTLTATISLFILLSLMKSIKKCETPFSLGIIKKMKVFAISLLPIAVASTVSNSLGATFVSSNDNLCIIVNWGMLVAAIVLFVLVRIFEYGVKLQTESDETL